jgi:hypothetical protein
MLDTELGAGYRVGAGVDGSVGDAHFERDGRLFCWSVLLVVREKVKERGVMEGFIVDGCAVEELHRIHAM